MRSSYLKDDVTILLKDITGMVKPQPTQEREKLIQSEGITVRCFPLNMSQHKNIWRFMSRHFCNMQSP